MKPEPPNPWTRFWFTPAPVEALAWVRGGLCIVTALYFVSVFSDVAFWYAQDAPASTTNLSEFFRTAELTSDARWMVSPLYWFDALTRGSSWSESVAVYRAYLVIGIILSVVAAIAGPISKRSNGWVAWCLGGSLPTLLLWIWFVGWANRVVLLAGICEPILSVSLAALAIAPAMSATPSWRVTLAKRLLEIQTTLFAFVTTALMLFGNVWWNGTGAYALAAPEEDRFLSVAGTFFENPVIYEGTTAFLLIGLPLAVWLVRRESLRALGLGVWWVWCATVALLSAEMIYAATLGVLILSVEKRSHTSE
ncbi:MAG: hypothetical protein AAFX06_12505 [Planctomycetota bacterium]